jgi:hypothetical protein
MARNKNAGPACRVCGGDTEPVPDEHRAGGAGRTQQQRQCADTDCAGRDWWIQATYRRSS